MLSQVFLPGLRDICVVIIMFSSWIETACVATCCLHGLKLSVEDL